MHRPGKSKSELYDLIYSLVKEIPAGKVATYGQIGRIVGCGPRVVGYAMAATPAASPVPWHRVINSQGSISARRQGGGEVRQRKLLEDEGLSFDRRGRIDLGEAGWPGPGRAWLAAHHPDWSPV